MHPPQDLAGEAPDTWPPGKLISGTWKIERRIGHGAFGAAYLVVHQLLPKRKAVIKRLDERHSSDRKFIQSFIDEATMMDALSDCPQVMQPWDLNRSEDRFVYICMEYMAGGSLSALLERSEGKRLDPASAIEIAKQMLIALDHAHTAKILHLDIKPDNILLKNQAPPWIAKLADFGISYRIAEAAAEGHLQQQSTQFRGYGSAGYIPLEQVIGKRRDLDGRADLYALGMTLYRALTGRFAFSFDSPDKWPILIQGAEPPPPSRFRPELAQIKGLDACVLKLIARDRDDRFKSAAKALDALQSVGGSGGFSAKNPERPEGVPPTEKLVLETTVGATTSDRSSRRTALLTALGAIPVVAGGGYWLGTKNETPRQGLSSEDPTATERTAEAAVVGFLAKNDTAAAEEEVRKLRAKYPDSKVLVSMENEIKNRPTGQ